MYYYVIIITDYDSRYTAKVIKCVGIDIDSLLLMHSGHSFTSKTSGGLVSSKTDNSNYKYAQATHEHMPETGPKPAFLISGPGQNLVLVIPLLELSSLLLQESMT